MVVSQMGWENGVIAAAVGSEDRGARRAVRVELVMG